MNFRKIILVPLPPFFLITNCRLLFSSFQEGMMTKLSMKLPWHKILRIHIFRKSGTVRKWSKTLFYRLHFFNSCSHSCIPLQNAIILDNNFKVILMGLDQSGSKEQQNAECLHLLAFLWFVLLHFYTATMISFHFISLNKCSHKVNFNRKN